MADICTKHVKLDKLKYACAYIQQFLLSNEKKTTLGFVCLVCGTCLELLCFAVIGQFYEL